MRQNSQLAATVICLIIAGCASTPSIRQSPLEVSVKDDSFRNKVTYETGVTESGTIFDKTASVLFSDVDRATRKPTFTLQWLRVYSDASWRFYQEARAEDATQLPLRTVSRHVSSCIGQCTYSETYNIKLSSEQMRMAVERGFNMKIYSKSGREELQTIQSPMATALLYRISQDFPGVDSLVQAEPRSENTAHSLNIVTHPLGTEQRR